MFETIVAFAEAGTTDTAAVEAAAASPLAAVISFLPMVLIIVLLYFMMIRPQRKKEKETQKMLAAMKVGDKVVSIGGICGKVTKIKDDYVFVETGNVGTPAERTVIKFERSAIKSVEQKIQA